MDNSNKEQTAINAVRVTAIEDVHATKSSPGKPLPTTVPVIRMKRRRFAGLIVVAALGAIALISYTVHSLPAANYEGMGIALCVLTCGGFLLKHLVHAMEDADTLQDQQPDGNEGTISPAEPNPAGQRANLAAPPPETGQNTQ